MNLEPLKSIDSKAQKSRILKDLITFTLKNRGPKLQKHVSLKPKTSMMLKVQHVMNLRPHTSIYQKAQESIKLKAPKLWTWKKLKNSENLKPKFKKKQSLTYCSKSWKPLQKIWIWNLKKIILEAQKSITFKTKTMNIGTTKSINNEVESRCLERYTPQSVWTKKNINLEIQTSRNLNQKKSETSNSNKYNLTLRSSLGTFTS